MEPYDAQADEDAGQAVIECLKEQLQALPAAPGVYLFKDEKGNVLYVGKAASLRQRVRAYFAPGADLSPKHRRLVSRVRDIEFYITDSETEALILECNLIKRFRPRYNVRLKDDKNYPYLKIDLNEEWPRVYFTRRWEQDGARYFGPFASAASVRLTLDVLRKVFPFRVCNKKITGQEKRPCLEYDIGRCLGPCIAATTKEEYDEVIRRVILFLEGKEETVKQELWNKMEEAAERWDFERAARLRDQVLALEDITRQQKIASTLRGDMDVIGLAVSRDVACAQIFFIRQGRLIGREAFFLEGAEGEAGPEVLTGFIKQFYGASPNIPPLILVPHDLEDTRAITDWLAQKRGEEVKIMAPNSGEELELLSLALKNAKESLEQYRIKRLATSEVLAQALVELQGQLGLPHLPKRIECYDISNIHGDFAVGSLVVFEEGRPRPAHYRRYRIKTVNGVDDYAMLRELLTRRFKRSGDFKGETPWAIKPDLIVVDGGRGQLNVALEVMGQMGVRDIPVISLAKEREEIYSPNSPQPIKLPRTSPALHLLQRIRDEAHRFALSYHVKVRQKSTFTSGLDGIPGIGPKRKKALLRRFGSLARIKEAPDEEIAAVPGMTLKLARRIKQYLD